ncbi:MAG: hypothetical protein M1823_000258 [Watsoniomyces obsoletus]|nr:MAG: hypothetical protein M1823_000258 [Watsoniomyces obsoletus]
MRLSLRNPTATAPLLLSLFLNTPSVLSQSGSVLDSIPQCYQDCIKQSGDFTCNGLDIKCLCRLSNGNFLTNVITCIRANCDNNLNTTSLVSPVADTCAAYGVPIAPAVIANAQSIGNALAATSTSLTGATTITSTIASAGTMYVVAIPISAVSSTGGSGMRISTGSISTVTRMSISGGSAVMSNSTATSTSTSTSTERTASVTSTTATAIATATQSVNVVVGEGGRSPTTSQGGNGSPFSNAGVSSFSKTEGKGARWMAAVVCTGAVLVWSVLMS